MATTYQNIANFLARPFNPSGMYDSPELAKTRKEFDRKYEKAKDGIFFVASTEFEGSYFHHLKIPSESKAGVQYDVVIQFFTADKSVEAQENLSQYLLQFFSNSPSFVFQYAALYYKEGYLIDAFQRKLDSRVTDPSYTPSGGAKDKLMFDKSLYFACKYIQENSVSLLQKQRLKTLKQVSMPDLLRSITSETPSSGKSGNVVQDLKIEMQKDKQKASKFIKDVVKLHNGVVPSNVKIAKTVIRTAKKVATKSTLSTPRSIVQPKKKSVTSTSKKK